jgi:hypothetical protein
MRGAEFDDLANLLVRFTQIGIVIAQTVIVKSGRPIGHQRYEE